MMKPLIRTTAAIALAGLSAIAHSQLLLQPDQIDWNAAGPEIEASLDTELGGATWKSSGGAHSNGANCTTGNYPLGVDENGAVESCTAVPVDTNTQLTQEQVEDYAGGMVSGNTETFITVTYDAVTNTFDFVVDDMNDDVPESGDFGNAVDLEPDGSLSVGVVDAAALDDIVTAGTCSNCNLTVTADGRITVLGTGSSGGSVDNLSNVATDRILGRVTAGSGTSEELTQAQVLTFLGGVEAGADVTDIGNVEPALEGRTKTGSPAIETGDYIPFFDTSNGSAMEFAEATVSGLAVDLGNNATDDTTDLIRLNTANDTNSIITENVADELLIDMGQNWPTADTVVTNANLTGDITSIGNATTISVGAVDQSMLSVTGTPDGTKFMRDDYSWQSIPGGGDALVANPLSQFAATTSAQFAGVISNETGSGSVVLATSPTLVTPDLGTPSALVATNATGTASGLTAGTANAGDSATAFFSSGTIEVARLPSRDISDDTNLAAGRSLTLSGDSIEGDAELYTDSETFIIETATTADDLRVKASGAITLVQLDCVATGATTPSAQVMDVVECSSAAGSCASSGLTATVSALTTNVSDASPTDAAIDDGDWWGLDTTSLTTAADLIHCTVEFTRND